METIKKYLTSLGITLGLILAFSFFLNILNYFDLLNSDIYKIILIITSAISILAGSFILGKKSDNKGYLEGIKFGLITTILFLIISFLAFDQKVTISSFIYYL
ncbi:MAG: TIGR04086 family membrane protein, partial [Bacilli bacterium]